MPAVPADHVDVLIVGAGISGIGTAWYLQDRQPERTYAILEMRDASGGTWDLFRYPGIRSDSDLHTFGYAFKPWTGEDAIADADAILAYLRETAADAGIDEHIRYGRKVLAAEWDSTEARWTVTVEDVATGETTTMTAGWLFSAAGYYRYDQGYRPDFPGEEDFAGTIVHPQEWPEDLDYAGKRVVVIGSGATAVTLVPSMADDAEHVTMLQRSPSYVMPVPKQDPIANVMKRVLPDRLAYDLTRRRNIAQQRLVYRFCQARPGMARWVIRRINAALLPDDFDVDTHFNPAYDPWDQRLCAVPNGDLFRAIRKGTASIVTDHIDTFTPDGIRLQSGEELSADIIITATGLQLEVFGGIDLTVDGTPVDVGQRVAFRGMMLSGVPNMAFAIGYTNSSWTLKVDLVCEHLMRILDHMDRHGHDIARPELPEGQEMTLSPLLDFQAGYVKRSMHLLPRAGEGKEWQVASDYKVDVSVLRDGPVVSEGLRFGTATVAPDAEDVLEGAATG
ncbi:NAD(P)/FAD-dependent oxidoreductase [Euzebya pacifica]|uniref:flavin-containing monooxygenase n=1 Tax=Euzebya pacifica TaxID=1608957 RepID=UPI0030F6C37F